MVRLEVLRSVTLLNSSHHREIKHPGLAPVYSRWIYPWQFLVDITLTKRLNLSKNVSDKLKQKMRSNLTFWPNEAGNRALLWAVNQRCVAAVRSNAKPRRWQTIWHVDRQKSFVTQLTGSAYSLKNNSVAEKRLVETHSTTKD